MKTRIPFCVLTISLLFGLISGCTNVGVTQAPNEIRTDDTSQLQNTPVSSTLSIDSTDIQTQQITTTEATQNSQWQSNWLHFGIDNQFSSYKTDELQISKENISNLEFISGSGCNDAGFTIIGGTPSTYRGQMILTYAGGNLEVGDPYTDKLDWSFGKLALGWAPPPVVSTDGIVYFLYVTSDASSLLFAVDLKSQQQLWESIAQFKTGFNFDSQVTVDEKNGQIYVIEGDFGNGRLFGIDRATGEILWFIGEKSEDEGATFVGTIVPIKDDKLFVTARIKEDYGKPRRSVKVDPLTQQIEMTYDHPDEITSSWDVGWNGLCNDNLYSTYQNNSQRKATLLAANSIDQPDITWQATIPAQTGRFACDSKQSILYVPTEKGLLALDAQTGAPIWQFLSPDSVFTPTIANGIIYFTSVSNMIALDQDDGSVLFRYPLGIMADPSTGVAINDGLVIFSGSGGTCDLYVLGLK